ncbi:MAG: amidohydrolase family protein [Treponemataceae bacterium]
MVVDAHAHYGEWYFPVKSRGAEEIRISMRSLGIDRTLFSSSSAIVYDFREGNKELAEVIAPVAEFYGYVSVNANYLSESLKEMETYLARKDESRFVGVKVHPSLAGRGFDCDECLRISEAAAKYDAPILIHTFGSPIESPRNVLKAAEQFPQTKFILAHMGGYSWEDGIAVALQRKNTYLEICGTCTDTRKLRAAIQAVGPERVLFGTDATLFAPEYVFGSISDMGLTEAERSLVMGENAERIFGLNARERRQRHT